MKTASLLFGLLFMVMATTAQSAFRYSGTINGLESVVARLTYIADQQQKQISTDIRNGQFEFNGLLPEPERVGISFTGEKIGGEIFFFADNENLNILVDTLHWDEAVITGSQTQKEYELYSVLTKTVDEKSNALNRVGSQLYLSGKLNELQKDSLFKVHDQLDLEKRIIIADFAKKYPSSAVSAWAISVYYGYEPNLDELIPAYHSLSTSNQQGQYGKIISEIIDAAKKTAIGKKATDFTITDIKGRPVSLSSYRGKYLLVDFWASWCGPCRAENPNVVRVYKLYHSEKFDILGVSLDSNRELWRKAIKKRSVGLDARVRFESLGEQNSQRLWN